MGGAAGVETLGATSFDRAVNYVSQRFGANPALLPSQAEVNGVMNRWVNTNMPDKYTSVLYHYNEHADGRSLGALTQNGINVWNNYIKNPDLVKTAFDIVLKNGATGVKISLNSGAGGIFTKAGEIVTTWFH